MGIVAIVLLACAVLVVVGAEWPRLGGRLEASSQERRSRSRERRKQRFTVIEGARDEPADDADDFAASVQRDLESLPVIEERDRS